MRSVRIPGSDPTPLGAPPDWNETEHGHCGGLFIRRERLDGVDFMRSAWEVEANEAALLFSGATLILGIQGYQHPVVHLQVANLPDDFEPTVTARRFTDLRGRPCVRVEMLFPHAGGSRGWIEVLVDGTLADAVSTGITKIEEMARENGWIK